MEWKVTRGPKGGHAHALVKIGFLLSHAKPTQRREAIPDDLDPIPRLFSCGFSTRIPLKAKLWEPKLDKFLLDERGSDECIPCRDPRNRDDGFYSRPQGFWSCSDADRREKLWQLPPEHQNLPSSMPKSAHIFSPYSTQIGPSMTQAPI